MSKPHIINPTVRRWRKAFLGIYLAFAGGVGLWILVSLVASTLGAGAMPNKGPRIRATADDPRELRQCQRDLERLLTDLHQVTFDLPGKALKYDIDPSAEWHNWTETWRMRWNALDWRCRLHELSGNGVSPAIDRMASIHGALEELRLSYAGVVDTFIERHLERLRRLRKDLARVRADIDQSNTGRTTTSTSGASK